MQHSLILSFSESEILQYYSETIKAQYMPWVSDILNEKGSFLECISYLSLDLGGVYI